MREDSTDPCGTLAARLLLPEIALKYDPAEWIREDWAYSVQQSRAPKFAGRFPARSRRIGEILRAAAIA